MNRILSRWIGIAVLVAIAGCGSGGGAESVVGRPEIERLAKWYQLYKASNRGTPPPNEEAFIAFVKKTLVERGQTVPDDLLVSPRDGKKYVVTYGKKTSNNPERNVVAYESEGSGGKKWMATESAFCEEVDDAELQTRLAAK